MNWEIVSYLLEKKYSIEIAYSHVESTGYHGFGKVFLLWKGKNNYLVRSSSGVIQRSINVAE